MLAGMPARQTWRFAPRGGWKKKWRIDRRGCLARAHTRSSPGCCRGAWNRPRHECRDAGGQYATKHGRRPGRSALPGKPGTQSTASGVRNQGVQPQDAGDAARMGTNHRAAKGEKTIFDSRPLGVGVFRQKGVFCSGLPGFLPRIPTTALCEYERRGPRTCGSYYRAPGLHALCWRATLWLPKQIALLCWNVRC